MANDKKKMVEAITAQEVDFAQWYTDICTKAELVEYSSVKAVCAEIVDNVAVGGNLFRLDLKLVGQIVTDAAENFGIHNLTPL